MFRRGGVGAEDALLLLGMALRCAHAHARRAAGRCCETGWAPPSGGRRGGGRFVDARMERRCVRAAARRFGEVRPEDLARLPARVVAGLLGADGLAAGREDEV